LPSLPHLPHRFVISRQVSHSMYWGDTRQSGRTRSCRRDVVDQSLANCWPGSIFGIQQMLYRSDCRCCPTSRALRGGRLCKSLEYLPRVLALERRNRRRREAYNRLTAAARRVMGGMLAAWFITRWYVTVPAYSRLFFPTHQVGIVRYRRAPPRSIRLEFRQFGASPRAGSSRRRPSVEHLSSEMDISRASRSTRCAGYTGHTRGDRLAARLSAA